MSTTVIDRWLTCAEAADIIRVEPQTMARWAMAGRGPRFSKLNSRVVALSAARRR